jgi:hypothetical protein
MSINELIFQAELDQFVTMWNNHYIRKTHNDCIDYGYPSLMYEVPETYGAEDCLVDVDSDKLEVCVESDLCVGKPQCPCQDNDLFELFLDEMATNNLNVPNNVDEALVLYNALRPIIRNMLGVP